MTITPTSKGKFEPEFESTELEAVDVTILAEDVLVVDDVLKLVERLVDWKLFVEELELEFCETSIVTLPELGLLSGG